MLWSLFKFRHNIILYGVIKNPPFFEGFFRKMKALF